MMRNIENKNYRFVSFLPDGQQKIPKKFIKYLCGFISSQNWLENDAKERKQKLQFRYVPIQRVTENSKKNSKIIQKIKKKNRYGFISSQKRLEKAEKEIK